MDKPAGSSSAVANSCQIHEITGFSLGKQLLMTTAFWPSAGSFRVLCLQLTTALQGWE
jgi:hypothetical protein